MGLIGFIIPIIPISIYLISKGALLDCLNSAYLNIMSGFDAKGVIDQIKVINRMLIEISQTGAIIVVLGIIIAGTALIINKNIKQKEYKKYIIGAILGTIINLYANMVAGTCQLHYMITFIPIICMGIALAIKAFDKIKLKQSTKNLILIIVIMLISSLRIYKIYRNLL